MAEIWRTVPDYPSYDVSDLGRVRSWKLRGTKRRALEPRILKGHVNASGYRIVSLSNDKGARSIGVHRLVAWAFRGPCPDDHYTTHSNGDPGDNRLENVRYATPIQNSSDALLHAKNPDADRDIIYWASGVREVALQLAQDDQWNLSAEIATLVREEDSTYLFSNFITKIFI